MLRGHCHAIEQEQVQINDSRTKADLSLAAHVKFDPQERIKKPLGEPLWLTSNPQNLIGEPGLLLEPLRLGLPDSRASHDLDAGQTEDTSLGFEEVRQRVTQIGAQTDISG